MSDEQIREQFIEALRVLDDVVPFEERAKGMTLVQRIEYVKAQLHKSSASLSSGALGVPPEQWMTPDDVRFRREIARGDLVASYNVGRARAMLLALDTIDWLRASLAAVSEERDAARKDTERLDWLEGELERERAANWTRSLFRQNVPITRAAIDAAISAALPVVEEHSDG